MASLVPQPLAENTDSGKRGGREVEEIRKDKEGGEKKNRLVITEGSKETLNGLKKEAADRRKEREHGGEVEMDHIHKTD